MSVHLIDVVKHDIVSSINAVGQVESVQKNEISSKLNGIIENIHVKEGMDVQEGQTLLSLINETGTILIKSPISGRIVYFPKDNIKGKYINIGEHILTVADVKYLRVEAYINEIDMGLVQKEQKAIIKSDAFRDKTFSGKICYIAPEVREINGISKILIHISLDRQNSLIPGNKVSLQIITASKGDIKSVPIEAVIDINNKKYLLLEKQGCSFLQEITIGISDINNIEVICDSIKEGDRVILDYQNVGCKSGIKIKDITDDKRSYKTL
jgi:multidrug efflux pump subunit AcrA (membrane-fusion protein)